MELVLKYAVAKTIVFPLLTAGSPTRKTGATLAAGDFIIARHTGGSWVTGNPSTATPTEIGTTGMYALPLTATELTPDDMQYPIVIACHDVAGAQWDDQAVLIRVHTYNMSDIAPEVGGALAGLVTTVGVAGAGLTALGDTRMAHLMADITSTPAGVGAAMTLTAAYDAAKTAAPTALANADAVWDEALSGHTATGSAGKALASAGAASDPLLNPVPGSYPSGSAGAALGSIGSAQVIITSPVANSGIITIYAGDDYYAVDGRSIDVTDASGLWPDLTGATVTFKAGAFSKAMTVITPTGTAKKVRLELTKVETASILPRTNPYKITAVLATTAHVTTLVESLLTVLE